MQRNPTAAYRPVSQNIGQSEHLRAVTEPQEGSLVGKDADLAALRWVELQWD